MKKIIKKTKTAKPKIEYHNSGFYIQSSFENVAGVTGFLATALQTKREINSKTILAMKTLLKDAIDHLDTLNKITK